MRRKNRILVGIDIGTTKTTVIVGETTETGIDIIGMGMTPARDQRKGGVINIDSTVEEIKKAVDDAEHMSGCRINSAYVGISGAHVKGQNSLGIVAVKGREVGEDDVHRAIEASRAIAIPVDREILHTLPQNYVVDGQDGIRDPVGMSGVRLEAKLGERRGIALGLMMILLACLARWLFGQAPALLAEIQQSLFEEAKARLDANIRSDLTSFEQVAEYFGQLSDEDEETSAFKGWVRAPWSRPTGAELDKVVERLKALKLTLRNAPSQQPATFGPCVFTGQPGVEEILIGRSY